MMKEIILLFSLSATRAYWMRAKPGPDCWYQDKVCDNSREADVIQTELYISKPEDCYQLCKTNAETETETDKQCKHFRWTPLHGEKEGACTLLRNCDKGDCTSGDCLSGPADCEAIKEPCPQLQPANAGADKVSWNCGGPQFNPYNSPIPVDTTCTASCPAWKDTDGNAVEVTYTCEAGTDNGPGVWGDLVYTGTIVGSPIINDPSKPTDCTAQCEDYPLWYNPNDERGARFFCDPPLDFTNVATEVVNLPQDGECFLFCDNMMVADIFCNNGLWTDISQDPEVGISCFGPVPPKSQP